MLILREISMGRIIIIDKSAVIAFGRQLKKIRKERKLSQAALAYEAGLATTQIARIELGEINTSLVTIATIARTLNIPLKELFDFKLPNKK